MKVQDRQLKRSFKIIILFLLLLSFEFFVLYKLKQYPKNLIDVRNEDKNYGTASLNKVKNKHYIKVYHFPDTKITKIDQWLEEEMGKHDQIVSTHLKNNHKHEVKQDYNSQEISGLISIRLQLMIDGAIISETAQSFDKNTASTISLSNLFTETGNNHITQKLRQYFAQGDVSRHEFLTQYTSHAISDFYIHEDHIEIFDNQQIYRMPLDETTKFLAQDLGTHQKSEGDVPSIYLERGIDPDEKLLAFTFDDGPHWDVTERVMNKIEEYDGQATFFVVGERIEYEEDYQSMIRSMLDRGHQLANHSYNHTNFNALSSDNFNLQIDKTNQVLKDATGYAGPYMVRPPYGAASQFVKENTNSVFVNWSLDTMDWKYRDPQLICDIILNDSEDGDIVLLHDLYETSYEGFKCALDELADEGYQFITVKELLKARAVDYQPGNIYNEAYKAE